MTTEAGKKKEVECLSVIKYYNANMGGIDKSDMLAQLSHSPMKSKKWYMRLYAYYLNLYVCNAWLCYWRDYESLGEAKILSLKKKTFVWSCSGLLVAGGLMFTIVEGL